MWGTIATPAIVILVLSFLFFLINFFLPILLSVAATYIGISITVAVLKLDNGGLDLVYTLIIANVLIELQHSLYFGLTLAR